MEDDERKEYVEMMKDIMVLSGKCADLSEEVYKMWKKIDEKLNNKGENDE